MTFYLFLGYAVFWSLLFVYLVYLHRRQVQINREITNVARTLQDDQTSPCPSSDEVS